MKPLSVQFQGKSRSLGVASLIILAIGGILNQFGYSPARLGNAGYEKASKSLGKLPVIGGNVDPNDPDIRAMQASLEESFHRLELEQDFRLSLNACPTMRDKFNFLLSTGLEKSKFREIPVKHEIRRLYEVSSRELEDRVHGCKTDEERYQLLSNQISGTNRNIFDLYLTLSQISSIHKEDLKFKLVEQIASLTIDPPADEPFLDQRFEWHYFNLENDFIAVFDRQIRDRRAIRIFEETYKAFTDKEAQFNYVTQVTEKENDGLNGLLAHSRVQFHLNEIRERFQKEWSHLQTEDAQKECLLATLFERESSEAMKFLQAQYDAYFAYPGSFGDPGYAEAKVEILMKAYQDERFKLYLQYPDVKKAVDASGATDDKAITLMHKTDEMLKDLKEKNKLTPENLKMYRVLLAAQEILHIGDYKTQKSLYDDFSDFVEHNQTSRFTPSIEEELEKVHQKLNQKRAQFFKRKDPQVIIREFILEPNIDVEDTLYACDRLGELKDVRMRTVILLEGLVSNLGQELISKKLGKMALTVRHPVYSKTLLDAFKVVEDVDTSELQKKLALNQLIGTLTVSRK